MPYLKVETTHESKLKAILQSPLTKLVVNRESRIVEGVKLLENNRDVTYKGADGKAVSFRTNPALLSGLIGHAGNRAIPSHLSHEWSEGKREALFDRVGCIKNCRLSDAGDLIGDFHAMSGEKGDSVLWLAENDPEHCALSCIFDYNAIKTEGVTYAYPLSFESADVVARGAGVTAFLSKPTDTDMTKEEIQALIDDGVAAKLKDFKPEGYITEAEAGERIKAALSAFKTDSLKIDDKTKAEIVAEAEAALVAKLGGGPLLLNLKKEGEATDNFKAKLAKYRETSKDDGTAIARLLRDHPELTPQREAHLQAEMAKLSNAA